MKNEFYAFIIIYHPINDVASSIDQNMKKTKFFEEIKLKNKNFFEEINSRKKIIGFNRINH
jgi:hypothetical protein